MGIKTRAAPPQRLAQLVPYHDERRAVYRIVSAPYHDERRAAPSS
jgi:hypothetical protein